jgi:hypothetical protein
MLDKVERGDIDDPAPEIVSSGEADVGVERGGEPTEQGDGGFGAALEHTLLNCWFAVRES